MNAFQQTQAIFANHIRHPQQNPLPDGIEPRRMAIYNDLFYNNIENFASSTFPVLRSIISDERWHQIVRDFVHRHQSHTPYFLEISQEFLRYFQDEFIPQSSDPIFLQELAHYEWVELALDVSNETMPEVSTTPQNLLDAVAHVSPLAWRLSYQFPVHSIGADYQPTQAPANPTFLIVYRNRANKVHFMETNAATFRLLQLLEVEGTTLRDAITELANEMQHPQPEQLFTFAETLIQDLADKEIISHFTSN